MTPLWVIASFLSLTETVAGVVATQTGGGVQVALTCFVIGFPVLVFAGFFAILWNRNYVLYPPTEFGDLMDVTKYVGAMRPPGYPSSPPETLQSTVAANLTMVAEVTAGPSSVDETKKTQPESPTPEHWFELYHNKQYDLAVAALVKQSETEKTDSGTTKAMVGRILFDKSTAEGIAYFEATFNGMPREVEPYVFLANAYMFRRQFDEALQVIDRGLAAGADLVELSAVRARCLERMGRFEEAITLLKTVIQQVPHNPRPHLVGAQLLDERKDVAQAENWYRAASALDAENTTALSALARIALDAGRKEEALSLYKRLVAMDPDEPAYRAQLGNVYLTLGLNGKALAAYEKADELAKHEQAWIIANIGNILKNQGFYPKAVEYLQEAAKMEPTSDYAHERLATALRAVEEEDEQAKQLLEAGNLKALKGSTS